MSRQNIFDNETFFNGYKALRESDCNANDLIEQPAMRKLLPNLNGKTVLEVQTELSALTYPKRCLPLPKKNQPMIK